MTNHRHSIGPGQRRRIKERANNRCENCGKTAYHGTVHHLQGDCHKYVPDSDLILLCYPCHERLHGIKHRDKSDFYKLKVPSDILISSLWPEDVK
jgi:hypothetical protein